MAPVREGGLEVKALLRWRVEQYVDGAWEVYSVGNSKAAELDTAKRRLEKADAARVIDQDTGKIVRKLGLPRAHADQHNVEVVESASDKVVKRMGPMLGQMAEKVERGLEINLDHDRYHVRTVKV